jgi:hypothetical protein
MHIVTSTRLTLSRSCANDQADIARLCGLQLGGQEVGRPQSDRVGQLIRWSSAAHHPVAGLWSVRIPCAAEMRLLGVALVLLGNAGYVRRVAVSMADRDWGRGYALDIFRELLAWADRGLRADPAESYVPRARAQLTRMTLAQMLTLPESGLPSELQSDDERRVAATPAGAWQRRKDDVPFAADRTHQSLAA